MQSKIMFVVLFMLSFSIVHDTVIHMLETDDKVHVSYDVTNHTGMQECPDKDEIHSMFHFVAFITSYKNTFIQLKTEKTLSYNLLQDTLQYREASYKPPIV